MADFSLGLNEDQLQIQKWVHDFAETVVRPAAEEWDEREEFPWPIVEEAAKIGLYSFDFMASAMMGDPTGLTMPVAIEELFWGDAGIGLSIMGSGLAAAGIAGNGTPEQTMEWVPQCYGTPDKIALGAFCVSEPDAGSDVSSLRTRAVYDEAKDEWVLNGTKAWITNAGVSKWYTVMAVTDPDKRANGISAFVVHVDDPGFEVGTKERKLGIKGSPTCEIHFTDCAIPLDRIIGEPGTGFKTALKTLDQTRPTIGAQAVGIAQGALDAALGYVKDRKQFGQSVSNFQGVQFMLADMAMKTEAARQLMLSERDGLPGDDEIEIALVAYHELFGGQAHAQRLRAQREEALRWMQRLASFMPLLVGGVAAGWATAHSDIRLELVAAGEKAVALALLNLGVSYRTLHEKREGAADLWVETATGGARLTIRSPEAARQQPRRDRHGNVAVRYDAGQLAALLAEEQ